MKQRKYIEPLIHSLIWLAGFILVAGFVQNIGYIKRDLGNFIYPVTVGTLINVALFYTVSFWLIGRYCKKSNWKRLTLYMVLLLFGATFAESILDFFLFPVYYSSQEESYFSQFIITIIINIFIMALALGYGFIRVWVLGERQKQELKSEKLSAELNYLKNQVNPHVLFNMLNMAYSSASKSGDEKTADIIEKIASQMRYMLYDSNVDKIALSKEIEHINGYVALQKMRISSEMPVKVIYTISGDIDNSSIAPLLLVPFVENAFKYGVSFKPGTEIIIELKCSESELHLFVSNSIRSDNSPKDKRSSGIGLENVGKRLKLLYPQKHKLEILENGEKFIVNLTLNLK